MFRDRAKMEKLHDGNWAIHLRKGQALSLSERELSKLREQLSRESVAHRTALEVEGTRVRLRKPIAITVIDSELPETITMLMKNDITVQTDNLNMSIRER